MHADQDVARATRSRVLDQLAAQRPGRLDAGGLQRRHQGEEGGGGDRRQHQEQRDAPVGGGHAEADVTQIDGHGAHRPVDSALEREARYEVSAAGGGQREQHAFGQQLPDNAAPRCANRQSNADFPLTRHAAGEQQVRDVGATDQQDQSERDEQRREDRDGFEGLRHGAATRYELDAHGPVGGRRLVRVPCRELGAGALHRHAGFQASDNLDADLVFAAADVRHEIDEAGERRPEVGRTDLETAEPFRHHSDDLVWRAGDEHRASNHVGIAVELALPSLVAQHEDGVAACAIIVGSAERASHDRVHAHDTEEARRHEIDRHHPPIDPQIDFVHRRVGLGEDVRVRSQRFETLASEL